MSSLLARASRAQEAVEGVNTRVIVCQRWLYCPQLAFIERAVIRHAVHRLIKCLCKLHVSSVRRGVFTSRSVCFGQRCHVESGTRGGITQRAVSAEMPPWKAERCAGCVQLSVVT